MIADAGFVFSIAALNASFAGLGGLLLGLRRGSDLDPLDTLRLRQVVEFAFANLLVAITVQPVVSLAGQDAGFRLTGALSLAYVVLSLPVLQRRVARVGISWGRAWVLAAIGLSAIGAALSAATIAAPTLGVFELLLVALLARPMVVFVLVLASIDEPDPIREERRIA